MPYYTLPKNLSLCFSIMKRPHPSTATAAATWDNLHPPSSSTSPPYNYNSHYQSKPPFSTTSSTTTDTDMLAADSPPDLATAYASRRFFISSPGRSNSIVDSSSSSEPDSSELVGNQFSSMQKYSMDSSENSQNMLVVESPPDLATAYISRRFFVSSPGRSNSIVASSSSEPDSSELVGNQFSSLQKYSLDSSENSHNTLVVESPPDLATTYTSHRLFISSPDRSNSMIDSSSSSEPDSSELVSNQFSTVQTDSPDPYRDFRRSMEEMVDAHGLHDIRESWNSLHELLLCYLSLNPKITHQFIVAAFADLLISLMPPPPPPQEVAGGGGGLCPSQ